MANSEKMFGVPDMDGYATDVKLSVPARPGNGAMAVMSMLSDVQEMVANGMAEEATAVVLRAARQGRRQGGRIQGQV